MSNDIVMDDALTTARKFLESLQRFELSTLLGECSITIQETKGGFVDDDWFSNMPNEYAVVVAPQPIDEALRKLDETDRKRVADAIANGWGRDGSFDLDVQTVKREVEGVPALLAEMLIHREMMIDVSTGGQRIQEVNDYYRAREVRIRERMPADSRYANPHEDLWAWYHHWDKELPQWKDRRLYARQLFGPAIETLAKRSSMPLPEREATGWERVDRALSKARTQLGLSSVEEDFQQIGLLCREVLISLGQAVFDPLVHSSPDGVKPSETDANRMIGAFIAFAFGGASKEEVRAHAKASLRLALALQHRRTANQQLAALCLEATSSTVAVISIIARPK